jgi:hypothetical protein
VTDVLHMSCNFTSAAAAVAAAAVNTADAADAK